jgi:hypothetical protein
MILRLFSLVLALISFSAFANTRNEFKNALDSLNYELSVEWDQQDQTFFQEKIKNFERQVTQLKDSGVSIASIHTTFQEMKLPVELQNQIQTLISLGRLQTPQEIASFVTQHRDSMYSQGASWNGDVIFQVGFVVLLIAMIVGLIVLISNTDEYICTEYAKEESCYWTEDCMTYDEYGFCISYGSPYESCSYACLNGYWQENK